jgi:Family of unknown function (DUF5309)
MPGFSSYDEVGIKEDVSDVITNISPTKTPFYSSLKSEKIHQKNHQWQEDVLDAVNTSNAQIEGFTASAETLTPTTLRQTYTQILQKTIQVTGSADASLAHGRARESAYQMSKAMAGVKRDLESALCGGSATYTVGNDTTARTMAQAISMISSGNIQAETGTPALSETMVLNAMEQLYTVGGEASILMTNPSDKLVVSGFATATGRTRQFIDGEKTVTNTVDVYVTPWGELRVQMNRFSLSTSVLLYDPSYWKLLVFRNWFREVLAKTGDNTMQMIVGEFALKHLNFAASAAVTGIT